MSVIKYELVDNFNKKFNDEEINTIKKTVNWFVTLYETHYSEILSTTYFNLKISKLYDIENRLRTEYDNKGQTIGNIIIGYLISSYKPTKLLLVDYII